MKVQVVVGANYGDEGKGLVSGSLAREANKRKEKVLTVFYNGTSQRAHTFEGEIYRSVAAGTKYGSDTFYHRNFVIDPISLYITQEKPIIDGDCRIILPCDVILNRMIETKRGTSRHGSCGFGLFEAVKRSADERYCIRAKDLLDAYSFYEKLKFIKRKYQPREDDFYNMTHFYFAIDYIVSKCRIASFEDVIIEYDTVIFEGGQGLLLDQAFISQTKHLTPSSPGNLLIAQDIKKLNVVPELFYVSRSYMTRHGAGPMDMECSKEEINPDIIDKTNAGNEFQGNLRFGKIDLERQKKIIAWDASNYDQKIVNMVYTHMNYTNNAIVGTNGLITDLPQGVDHLYLSDQKDLMEKVY